VGVVWRWLSRIRELFHPRRVDREVADEIAFHIEMEVRERIDAGLDPVEARRQALIRFGGVDRVQEQIREQRFAAPLETLARDARYALRGLWRSPAFTVTALLTLGLGIGANTAIFSAVNATLLRPLPYSDTQEIHRIRTSWEGTPQAAISPAEFLDYQERLTNVVQAVGAYSFGAATVTGGEIPQRLRTAFVSAGFFGALGVAPARGRVFDRAEDEQNLPVVVIADGLWRSHFGSDPDVIGKTLTVNGRDREVVGVMPPGYGPPEDLLSGQATQLFAPQGIDQSDVDNRGSHYMFGVTRAGAGVDSERVARAFEALGEWMVDTYPDGYPADMGFRVTTVPLASDVRGPLRAPFTVLLGAVAFVFLIACANVASLMLARADRRAGEFSLRTALGASRSRLAAQASVESVVLGLAGGLAGLVTAFALLQVLRGTGAQTVAWLADLRIDASVLAVTTALSVLAALIMGLAPAISASRGQPRDAMTQNARGASDGRPTQRLRRVLVVVQLAVSLFLLTGGGLLLRSFASLMRVDPGFTTENVLTVSVSLPSGSYPSDEDRLAFFEQLVPRLGEIATVDAVGGVTNLPLASGIGDLNFEIEGRPIPEDAVSPAADWQVVTPGYLEAMGMALLGGRTISDSDDASSPGVVVINRTFAELHWPDEDPLGKRFRLGGGAGPGWVAVIGVVGDVRHSGLDQTRVPPQMYLAHQQFRFWGSGRAVNALTLALRHRGPVQTLQADVRRVVASLDGALPLSSFRSMADVRRASLGIPRLLTVLVGAFATVALVLAVVGIYGVITFSVGKRAREFGIRSALGATRGEVAIQVVREGVPLVLAGLALGLIGAFAGARVMSDVLYEVTSTDVGVYLAVGALLGGTSLLAMLIPARRATHVSPLEALRTE
jgi:putative ABC transport system permease protein